MDAYDPEVEQAMKAFSDSLSEKDRRRYAAVEVEKLGYGELHTSVGFWTSTTRPSPEVISISMTRKL